MNSSGLMVDANGTTFQVGDYVVLLGAPEELLRDLPSEDKAAIQAQIGKSLEVQGFDEHGHADYLGKGLSSPKKWIKRGGVNDLAIDGTTR